MFNNKKILFYGPANTKDKETININNYHIVIITNNMCENFFNKYNVKPTVLIYLLTNKIYSLKYNHIIQKYINKITLIFTISQTSKNYLVGKIDANKTSSFNSLLTFPSHKLTKFDAAVDALIKSSDSIP